MLDFQVFISLIGIIQALFLIVLIASKNKRNLTSKLTICLLIVFILNLIWSLLYHYNLLSKFWILIGMETVSLYLYGPFLYFYIKSHFTGKSILKFNKITLLHFIPALIVCIVLSPLFLRINTISFLSNFNNLLPISLSFFTMHGFLFEFIFWDIQVIIYTFLTIRFLKKMKKNDQLNYEINSRKAHLFWVKLFLAIFLLFPIIGDVDTLLNVFFNIDFNSFNVNINLLVLFIFVMSYISFLNDEIILNPITVFRQKTSNLTTINHEILARKLTDIMVNDKLYKNKDLTLLSLSKAISVTKHQLSEYLNIKKSKSFNEYINSYRIKDAEELLIHLETNFYTIEAIAYEVGFNSTATFYRSFKKQHQVSPSDWLKNRVLPRI